MPMEPLSDKTLPQVTGLYHACFADGWRDEDFSPDAMDAGNRTCFVLCREERAVAFLHLSLCPPTCEILHIATDPALRRQGLAGELLQGLWETLPALACHEVWLEVRESNTAARGLYEHHGFVQVGRRNRYYTHPTEDAILYTKGKQD